MDTTVNITESVTFLCSASGIPLPTITWLKDGSPVDLSVAGVDVSSNGTIVTSVLDLGVLMLSDAGLYSCNASHSASEAVAVDFTLTLQSKSYV